MSSQGAMAASPIYRQKKVLVVPQVSAAFLPCDTCIRCGAPASKFLNRRLVWHHPALLLLLLLGAIPFIIVALIVQKKIQLRMGMCAKHAAVRSRRMWIGWLLFFAAIGVWYMAASSRYAAPAYVFVLVPGLIVGSLVMAVLTSQFPVKPKRITDVQAELLGAGEGYLAQFPGNR